jgi:hypothetical protein
VSSQIQRLYKDKPLFELADGIAVLRDSDVTFDGSLRVEQVPVTLVLESRCSDPADGPVTMRLPRAAYDDHEVEPKLTRLGKDLLAVLEKHGF